MSKLERPNFNTSAPVLCADYLRELILNGKFESGQAIVLDRVARDLGISPTPVREAVRRLEAEGLVEYIPRKGAIVSSTLFEDFEQLVEVRKALEPILLKAAVTQTQCTVRKKCCENHFKYWANQSEPTERLTAQWTFYTAIYSMANKPLILAAAKANWQHIFRYHRTAWDYAPQALEQDFQTMQALYDAFLSGNYQECFDALIATIDWGYHKVQIHLTSQ